MLIDATLPDPTTNLLALRLCHSEPLVSLLVPSSRSCFSPRPKLGRGARCPREMPRRAAAELARRGVPPPFPYAEALCRAQ
jgi:hypothetical protein